MALKKRNGAYYLYFRPFKRKQIGVRLHVTSKLEAQRVEVLLTRACRTGDYSGLAAVSRETAIRMFTNQHLEIPADLGGTIVTAPREELVLWRASELFLRYPGVSDSRERGRYEACLLHLVPYFGRNFPLKQLWIPHVKEYQVHRLNEGAAPGTVNREVSCLSKLCQVMVELQHLQVNPVRLVKSLSEKSSLREVYLSLDDVQRIADQTPVWYQRIVWCAFFAGMRRGEIANLRRDQVTLHKRIIYLDAGDTKERAKKRIPLCKSLIPILEEAMRVSVIGSDLVFHVQDGQGVRPMGTHTIRNPWKRACKALGFEEPMPRFHDLRGTFKTNCRRSGMHPEIEMLIMGHSQRGRSVHERYGRCSDQELVEAVSRVRFDNGPTELLIPAKRDRSREKCEQIVNKTRSQKQRPCCNMA